MSGETIVPDGFDLERARRAPSTTPDEKRKRCPSCDSMRIRHYTGKFVADESADGYRCLDCGHHFSTPVAGRDE